jgi:hypothetical protein
MNLEIKSKVEEQLVAKGLGPIADFAIADMVADAERNIASAIDRAVSAQAIVRSYKRHAAKKKSPAKSATKPAVKTTA